MLALWEYFWTEADWVPPAAVTRSWVSVKVIDSIRKSYIFVFIFLYLLLGGGA